MKTVESIGKIKINNNIDSDILDFWNDFINQNSNEKIENITFPEMNILDSTGRRNIFNSESVTFIKCKFKGQIWIPTTRLVKFHYCEFSDNVYISNYSNVIEFINCKGLDLRFYLLNEDEKNDIRSLYIENTLIANLFIENYTINKLFVKQTYIKTCKLLNCRFLEEFTLLDINHRKHVIEHGEEILLLDINFDSNAIARIEKAYFKKYEFNTIRELPRSFKFLTTKDVDNFIIVDSNLNNFIFQNLSFVNTDIFLTNSNFINDNYAIFNRVEWSKNIVADRDTFRQLKLVNDLQGNNIQANKFYSLEMEEYKKELIETLENEAKHKNIKLWICKIRNMDYIVFKFSEIASDFSRSWVTPLKLLLYVNIVLSTFSGLTTVLFDYTKYRFALQFDVIINNLSDMLEFMNIFSPDVKGPIFFWMLNKIFSGLLIYQFIISARRQTKR